MAHANVAPAPRPGEVRHLRQTLRVTLDELAAATGRSVAHLSRVERGLRSDADLEVALLAHLQRRGAELVAQLTQLAAEG